MSDLQVVATIPAKPEAADQVRAALQELVDATRAEDGCMSYDLFESGSAPETFVTVERWRDAASLEAHMTTPHVAAAFAAAEGGLSGRGRGPPADARGLSAQVWANQHVGHPRAAPRPASRAAARAVPATTRTRMPPRSSARPALPGRGAGGRCGEPMGSRRPTRPVLSTA